jgi:hypothetical protein
MNSLRTTTGLYRTRRDPLGHGWIAASTSQNLVAKVSSGTILTVSAIDLKDMKNSDEEWIKALEDGRKVKFVYQELPGDAAFLTAQLAGNEVVYSVLLTKAKKPLTREDVESHFRNELSKK